MTSSQEANPPPPAPRERKKPGRLPTSCAECRRLKLRCDRKVPCENCVRRGCGTICPTGSLTSAKGGRLVLSSTEELHSQIETLSARVRELEEALQATCAQTSNDPIPSSSSAISLTSQASVEKSSLGSAPIEEPEPDHFIDAFGTLAIGTHGETDFMSSTARAEYLILHPLEKVSTWATMVQNLRLPARVINASISEHDIIPVDDAMRELVMSHRPPLSEAIRLCEIYMDWGKTLWNSLSRHELLEEIVGNVYRADSYESISGPHTLSLLFSIFALASLFDLSRPAYNVDAHEYYILSRVALQFSSLSTTSTLETVLTLENNLTWLDLSDLLMDSSRPYICAGLGVKLVYRMGLHLHSARFQLEKSVVQRRSTLFWQMFLIDTLLSFYTGRPPNVSLDWIDVPCPNDEFSVKNDKGEVEMSWRSWSWRFAKLLHEVLVVVFGSKIPTYSAISRLDQKIRDFPIPSHLQLQCANDTQAEPEVVLQRLLVLTMKESVLLNIHRRYFSQALHDSPGDPLKHRYGPSFMAVYRSAWRLIVGHSIAVDCIPDIAARVPIIWSQAFSAAIVMCMIVTRAPSSNVVASALHEVDVVYGVFKKAASTTRIASIFLEHVEKVWRKSHENVHHPLSEYILSQAELDRVGGGSTSLISKTNNAPSPSSCHSPTSTPDLGTTYANPSNITNPSRASNPPFDHASNVRLRITQDVHSFEGFPGPSSVAADTAGGPSNDYVTAPPRRYSHPMTDAQLGEVYVDSWDMLKAQQQALNTSHPAQPQPFHPSGGMHAPESTALDPAWQSFMEQLGF